MSCCGTFQRPAQSDLQLSVPAGLARIADAAKPAPVAFSGARTFTGTKAPVILDDGEGIVRHHRLKPFAVDPLLVTNARFAAFVLATGYRTEAERQGWGIVFRGLAVAPEELGNPGPAPSWWLAVEGARWCAPEGPGSDILDRADHPVTHVSWDDARAFAQWDGGRLATEAEWEHAARGGLDDPRFPWGEREPDDTGFFPCNIFQGSFPERNTNADGWAGTSPVTAFPPNGAGLHDMAGNVWEWTAEPFHVRSVGRAAKLRNMQARERQEKLMKGGSFLCHKSYCYRYRIAARLGVAADSGACNAGLRVFYDI